MGREATYPSLVLAVSIAWATYPYVVSERSNRVSWTAAPLPRMPIEDEPYRRTSIERRLVSAPFLVKATAFMCFFVGQAFALVMLVPALLLARGALLVTAGQPLGYVDLAFMVYRLGPPLLARKCRAVLSERASHRALAAGVIAFQHGCRKVAGRAERRAVATVLGRRSFCREVLHGAR